MNYIIDNLEKLLNIASPTGNTHRAIDFIKQEFEDLGLRTQLTQKGGLVASMDGLDNSKSICLSAHVDTLGAMVKEIKPNGRIKMAKLGGYSWSSVEGENVDLETLDGKNYQGTILSTKASVHVHSGASLDQLERSDENMELRLDELAASKEDVLDLGINVGDFISFDPRVRISENGFIKSRHLDDKAGVIALLALAKKLKQENVLASHKLNFLISNYEEVGHGAASIPQNTFKFIAVDMAAPGLGQESSEQAVTICAKDSSGPYDYEFRKELIQVAKEENLDYRVDIYPFYGSDGSAALRAGHDISVALIGPGVDASHSYERTHIKAIEATVDLAYYYLIK